MPPKFIIFTAAVKAGKTTALMHWAAARTDLGGFLAPDYDQLRYLYTLQDRQLHAFQLADERLADMSPEEVISIHRFHFSAAAFELARRTILTDVRQQIDWVVIDEVGKLEVRGEGLEPAVGQAVELIRAGDSKSRLLLVVREELVEAVIGRYRLEDFALVRLGEALPE